MNFTFAIVVLKNPHHKGVFCLKKDLTTYTSLASKTIIGSTISD